MKYVPTNQPVSKLKLNGGGPNGGGPKYKNDKPAKVGDEVIGYDSNGYLVSGIIVELTPTGFVHNCRVLSGKDLAALPLATVQDLIQAGDVLGNF
jgi:hypothetical protein